MGKGEAVSKDRETRDSADAEEAMSRKETQVSYGRLMMFGQLLDAVAAAAPVVGGDRR